MSNYSGAEKIRITLLSDVARQTGCGKANCHSCRHMEEDIEYDEDEDENYGGTTCSKMVFGDGYLEDGGVNLDEEKPCWEPDFWEFCMPELAIGRGSLDKQLKTAKQFYDFVDSIMPTNAYCEYMAMADKLFEHIRNGTTESEIEAVKTEKKQQELWDQMTVDERIEADDTVLRTVIYLKSIAEKKSGKQNG